MHILWYLIDNPLGNSMDNSSDNPAVLYLENIF